MTANASLANLSLARLRAIQSERYWYLTPFSSEPGAGLRGGPVDMFPATIEYGPRGRIAGNLRQRNKPGDRLAVGRRDRDPARRPHERFSGGRDLRLSQ